MNEDWDWLQDMAFLALVVIFIIIVVLCFGAAYFILR